MADSKLFELIDDTKFIDAEALLASSTEDDKRRLLRYKERTGDNPLLMAAITNAPEALLRTLVLDINKILGLEHYNQTNSYGSNVLHFAAQCSGSSDFTEYLLCVMGDEFINVKDNSGFTPLDRAQKYRSSDLPNTSLILSLIAEAATDHDRFKAKRASNPSNIFWTRLPSAATAVVTRPMPSSPNLPASICPQCPRPRHSLVVCVDGMRPDVLLLDRSPFLSEALKPPSSLHYSFYSSCDGTPVSYPSWASTFNGHLESSHSIVDNDNPAAPSRASVYSLLKGAFSSADVPSQSLSVSLHCAGWWGLRNVLGGCGNTFEHSPGTCVVGSEVDKFYSYEGVGETSVAAAFEGDRRAVAKVLADLDVVGDGAAGAPPRPPSQASPTAVAHTATVLYLYAVDHVGHELGFGLGVPEYVKAAEVAAKYLQALLAAVERRRTELGEDWLFCVTTDHGGTSRRSMSSTLQKDFDDLQGGLLGAYGQKECEGLHGDARLPQHTRTFLLLDYGVKDAASAAPGTPLPGGELIAPEGGAERGLRNSDVAATLAAWYGCEDIIEKEGFVGKARGLRAESEADEQLWAQYKCRCCNKTAGKLKKKPLEGGATQP